MQPDGVITLQWILLPSQRPIQIDNHPSDFTQYKITYCSTRSEVWVQLPGTKYNGKKGTSSTFSRPQLP